MLHSFTRGRMDGRMTGDGPATGSRRRIRTTLAGVTGAALVAGLLTAPNAVAVEAAATPTTSEAGSADLRTGLVAEYLFEETSGDILRNSADGSVEGADALDATIRNYAADQRSQPGTLRFVGGAKTSTGNWVELPANILAGAQSATISVDVRVDSTVLNANHFLWNIGSESTGQYWFATNRAARSSITVSGSGGEKSATGYALTANRWHSVTAVLDAENDTLTYYTDGQRAGVAKTTLTPADITQTLNTIGRSPYNDQLFRGSVGAFRVYDRALDDSEVVSLSELDAVPHTSELAALSDAKLAAIDLGDLSNVRSDLQLLTLREISWASSDPSVLTAEGQVTRPAVGSADATVTLTATARTRGQLGTAPRTYTVTVPALTAAEVLAARDALSVPTVALGNISLPDQGVGGVPISWVSSDPAVITDAPNGPVAAGVVNRPEWGDTAPSVTLEATVGVGASALTRTFTVSVAPLPRPAIDDRYLFAYFTADTLAGENIYLATSQGNSAMNWDVQNGGQPAITSTFGERGLRDPFILRSPEGDRFFLIATDLSIGSGTSWDTALDFGSAHLEIWESTDLKNWSAQRHVKVSGPHASMTWAPEAYWDETAGEYVVYWSSRLYLDATRPYNKTATPNHTYSKVMYATTRDFVNFSPATVWEDAGDRIDSTMIKDGDMYYRFTKEVTGCVDIIQESSPVMRALTVPGAYDWQTDVSCLSKTARNTTRTTEGPTIFKANQGDTSLPAGSDSGFWLFVDDFTGVGYVPLFTESLADPQWQLVAGSLPRSRHGSVLPITRNQWETAKGETPSAVESQTTLTGIEAGDTLTAGDTLSAAVTATDNGPVAGTVAFHLGESIVTADVEAADGQYVATVTIPADLPAGPLQVSAHYQGLNPLADSQSTAVSVTVPSSVAASTFSLVVADSTVSTKETLQIVATVSAPVAFTGTARLLDGSVTIAEQPVTSAAVGDAQVASAVFREPASGLATGKRQYRVTFVPADENLVAGATSEPATVEIYFFDSPPTGPFFEAVSWLATTGITTGNADGSFRPTTAVSRQAMAAFLYRLAEGDGTGIPTAPACTVRPYTDVPVDSAFCGEIAWLKESGITTGYTDGSFRPTATINRQAMAAFLYRFAEPTTPAPACTAAPFVDVPVGHPFCAEISWLATTGITTGYEGDLFKPNGIVDRQAMAAFLYRLQGTDG